MNIFSLTFFILIFSAHAFATPELEVERIHARAVRVFQRADSKLVDQSSRLLVNKGLKKFFKLSLDRPEDREKIKVVFSMIRNLSRKVAGTTYKINYKTSGFWCMTDQLALVPPAMSKVHLCPAFFSELTPGQQTGTLIHEWFHRWGGDEIEYFPENYCQDVENLSSEELISSADQYMLFIYHVGTNGEPLPCF